MVPSEFHDFVWIILYICNDDMRLYCAHTHRTPLKDDIHTQKYILCIVILKWKLRTCAYIFVCVTLTYSLLHSLKAKCTQHQKYIPHLQNIRTTHEIRSLVHCLNSVVFFCFFHHKYKVSVTMMRREKMPPTLNLICVKIYFSIQRINYSNKTILKKTSFFRALLLHSVIGSNVNHTKPNENKRNIDCCSLKPVLHETPNENKT